VNEEEICFLPTQQNHAQINQQLKERAGEGIIGEVED
jgi:hypothetical protein